MLYSLYKDDKPLNTVKKIRKIIDSIDIKLQESFSFEEIEPAPVSLRLSLKNNKLIGTNGKGICKENALASAYAEFMERLQNSYLFPDQEREFNVVADKIKIDGNVDLQNEYLQNYFNDRLSVFNKLSKKDKNPDKSLFLFPFYSVKEQRVYNLPYNIIDRVKGTNGMAAGNTFQEALVQGFSEVCERYSLKKVFLESIVLPDIPEDIYLKYENIQKLIEYFSMNGYKVYVKDASLNGCVPVVCTIIEDEKMNVFTPSFGSHPSLPIAIERTLTEFAQGLILSKISECNSVIYPCYTKEKLMYMNYKLLYRPLSLHKVAFEKTEKLLNLFWSNKPSYEYSLSAWNFDAQTSDNEKFLEFLVRKILKFSNDIYVRNVSFLNFPSVDIFVPNITDLFEYSESIVLKDKSLDILWSKYHHNQDREKYNLDSLLKLAEIYTFSDSIYSRDIFTVSFEYIAFLCSIVSKNFNKIIKYADILIAGNKYSQTYDDSQIQIFKIIREYCLISRKLKSCDEKFIKNKLEQNYEKSDVKYAISIINELEFEMILSIVLNGKRKPKTRYKTLLKRLRQRYKNNLPNQMAFKEIFDFSTEESLHNV